MMRFSKAIQRDDSGVTIVEFAFVAPVMIVLITGLLEMGYVLFARSTLESAVLDAARTSRVANCPSENAKAIEEAIQARMSVIISGDGSPARVEVDSYGENFGDVGNPEPFDDDNGNGTRDPGEGYTDVNGNSQWDEDMGESGDFGSFGEVVRFKASYNVRSLIPFVANSINGGRNFYTIEAVTAVRNEPFMEFACAL